MSAPQRGDDGPHQTVADWAEWLRSGLIDPREILIAVNRDLDDIRMAQRLLRKCGWPTGVPK